MLSFENFSQSFNDPAFLRAVCAAQEVSQFVRMLAQSHSHLAVRFVRGVVMQQETGVLDEFAAAWQFPWYYGRNWNAFDECICDLTWVDSTAFLTVILDSEQLLQNADSDALGIFLGIMISAKAEWAKPVELGEWWDRPGEWFGTILHCEPKNIHIWEGRFSDVQDQVIDLPNDILRNSGESESKPGA